MALAQLILSFIGCYSLIQIKDILLQLLGLRTFVAIMSANECNTNSGND